MLWLLKLGITTLIHNKDDIEFVTEFPFFWGHLVDIHSIKNVDQIKTDVRCTIVHRTEHCKVRLIFLPDIQRCASVVDSVALQCGRQCGSTVW